MTRVIFQPWGVVAEVSTGTTLLDAARVAGVEIESVCGGRGTCAKCRVIVSEGVTEPTTLELRGLSTQELSVGYRLACQAVVVGDCRVVVPEEAQITRVSILADGMQRTITLEPWALRHTLIVPAPTLEDQMADDARLAAAWAEFVEAQPIGGGTYANMTLGALRQLPHAVRADEGRVTLLQVDGDVVQIEPGQRSEHLLGIAFDLGTTTVVGYLLDLETGEQLAVASLLNPQTRYGDDVVSRIAFSQREGGLETLHKEIVGALNRIVAATVADAGEPFSTQDIVAATVVGNTTMQHLLLGVSPAALAQSPYVPAVMSARQVPAKALGFDVHPEAHVWTLPNIAGWVGADTVGVLLATGIYDDEGISLAIDIGTNGEMAMGSRERLVTCSTAAGPAFEGAHLSCGMRAAEGAIDTVHLDGDVWWHSIGDAPPRGVCGSGLVDLVAEMLRTGIISTTGMMEDGETLRHNGRARLAERISQEGRMRVFELVEAAEGAGGRPVRVTQRDVRELQLAKGAIRAGIEILMKELGVTPADVQRVYLAGAFGNYVRPESALAIGLIPHFPHAEIIPVGNAAGSGAKMALLSRSTRELASTLVRRVEYLELSGRADFQEEFSEAMLFDA